jgi:Transposase DNA-binding/Transposase Tn5 dimerisation domain
MEHTTTSEKWADAELAGGKFRDKRLSDRMVQIAEDFSKNPTFPINQASEDAASTKAAYRFFSNPKAKVEKILEPHIEQTLKRMQNHSVVLAIQDTTSLKYHSHKNTEGLGEISKKGDTSVQGLFMHSVECVTPTGLPLGFIDQIIWARPNEEKLSKKLKKTRVMEEKESIRWIQCLRNTAELTKSNSAKVVTVCDREADIYDFFFEAKTLEQDVLVRCFHNREINDDGIEIWQYVNELPTSGRTEVEVKKTQKREARTARLNVKYGIIEIHPPETSSHTEIFSLSVVYVKEMYPPVGVEPLEWLLLTTLPVNSFEDASEKVAWYKTRWSIELFHRLLKSGLKVEECRLDEGVRLMRFLTLMTIVAWRMLWMTYVQRTSPDAPATTVLSETELKVLYYVTHKTKLPQKTPSLRDAIHWIARKGGFLDRKGDGEPGMITLWRGWNRLIDMVQGFEAFSSL